MVFSSVTFIFFFFPAVLLLYALAYRKGVRLSNYALLLGSVVFYAWGGVQYFIILMVVVTINYLLTLLMAKNESDRGRKLLLAVILIVDIGNLFYFKYCNFFLENVRQLGEALGLPNLFASVGYIALPIGISFYTFQIMSYVIDVYRKEVEPQKNLAELMLYVIMFPQLIAGPIVRYQDIDRELMERRILPEDVEEGICRFVLGFAKKVFLANAMGGMADVVFSMTGRVNTLYAWLGAICYSLQIYFDFSAYSDMAIGIGRMLGFHFNENFSLPYRSKSIQEFWRRWHISLSTWFRDYVYIPLGGNRKGTARTYLNLTIVFLLTGIWHGAAWQFIVWGLFHGAFMLAERVGLGERLKRLPGLIGHIYTLLIVIVGWVFFRADDLGSAVNYLRNMFVPYFGNIQCREIVTQFTGMFGLCLILALLFSIVDIGKRKMLSQRRRLRRAGYILLWCLSVLYLIGLSYNPFIYFKF